MKKLWLGFIFLLQTMGLVSVEVAKAPAQVVHPAPKIIPKVSVPKDTIVTPTQSAKMATTSKIPVIKSPLQLNIKNNSAHKAHLTGFTVTYADQTTEKPMTISVKIDMDIEPSYTKSIGFKIKIPNMGKAAKFRPFVSEIEINGKSIATGYQAIPHTINEQPYTLALLQITQKNGVWVRDIKAMKKANSTLPTPSVAVNQSISKITPLKEAVVAAAIEKNKNAKSKSKKSVKKASKRKRSKSSQAVDHALIN